MTASDCSDSMQCTALAAKVGFLALFAGAALRRKPLQP